MIHVAMARCVLPLLLIVIVSTSCQDKKATVPQQRYYYYPKANLYYDSKSLEYIYSLDSARTWVKVKAAGDQQSTAALGDQVVIKETSDEIWLENEMHRNMYGGNLYNVITRDTALLTEKPKEVRKPVSKQDSSTINPKKKRNIFQKIFGKKKN